MTTCAKPRNLIPMPTFAARCVVFLCTLVALAVGPFLAEGYLWLGYGLLAAATLGALAASTVTVTVPAERLVFGVLFATFVFGAITRYDRLSNGLTVSHVVAFILAVLVLRAFIVLSPRLHRRSAPQT